MCKCILRVYRLSLDFCGVGAGCITLIWSQSILCKDRVYCNAAFHLYFFCAFWLSAGSPHCFLVLQSSICNSVRVSSLVFAGSLYLSYRASPTWVQPSIVGKRQGLRFKASKVYRVEHVHSSCVIDSTDSTHNLRIVTITDFCMLLAPSPSSSKTT